MELSTFELLVKPIAPLIPGKSPLSAAIAAVARRVVQGYFLTISNLEPKNLRFRLEFVISKPNPINPDRTLFQNARVFVDVAGVNAEPNLLGTANSNRFSCFFDLPAGQTASVELLPDLLPLLFKNLPTDPDRTLEVRGYVKLTLPRLSRGVPQSDTPVKVLVNPEIRGTFLPNTFPKVLTEPLDLTGDFDQINYSLAIASGKALNEVPSDPPQPIVIKPILANVMEQIIAPGFPVPPILNESTPVEQAQELVGLMAQLDSSPENLQSFSDLLSKLEIPLQVSRR